ncbi:leucine efflux protein LeuE [Psychrobium sp. MM17-31]|uniref:leucine efflux protein LeuE n=1 Tax=Psychrobium sp. MM17-31 TaxID=2917758 RepID=UPI001EF71F6F|nr:leucine efflux protein LeuE [Psychrobium sp. MM17-31]MCG7530009.1 leucine efflux protein LeuE [Psychrobium sp. MM17-31]
MEYFGVINYVTYVIGAILIVLLPGPNSLYVLSLAAQHGQKVSWSAVAGVFLGDSLLMLATALGAVTLLTTYPALFMIIKYAGAAYLVYIGYNLLTNALKTWRQSNSSIDIHVQNTNHISGKKAFNKALLMSLLNPKAILFFLSFFVQFVDPQYSQPIVPFLILALTLQVFSLLYLATLIYAGSTLAHLFRKHKKVSALSGAGAGSGFIAFAAKLAFANAN